jgi:hypothetical protein
MSERKGGVEVFWLMWALVLSPAMLLVEFITLGLHVRFALGHWPKPMIENYSSTAYTLHEQVFTGLALFTYAAGPLWLLLLLFPPLRKSLRVHLIQAGVYAAGWGMIALCCLWDPYRFAEWFLD